ncbi:class I SAM-dependent methyltransferase [Parvularcula lutaonensis]|uniref:Class I SAM-dependent methyltransferase n=1 Tax=Parvularcula lutaonensis TaxID=491923 RepID=A0ABV7M987_9PROT|nr:class I SAM-dependent methyltransferase [Parvularcula lutaonensis]
MDANAQSFGRYAGAYAKARPSYPDALFDWIAGEAPATWSVLDVATGSGQAARKLAERFAIVHATDISHEQVSHAVRRPNIQYAVAEAEASALPDASVDAVTVATALHWFEFPRFWAEVRRVSRPGGLFCGWTYGLFDGPAPLMAHLIEPVLAIIDPYWAEGNRLALRRYPRDEIGFPFMEVEAPSLSMTMDWTVAKVLAFIGSWSAMTRARAEGEAARLDAVTDRALAELGDRAVTISMPLTIVAGRIA